jgi:DNA-binding XRE family transcriptional regulator
LLDNATIRIYHVCMDELPVPCKLKSILRVRKKSHLYPSSYGGLAAACDIAKNTVVHLAEGRYLPKLDTAYKIARALGLSVYDIWNERELEDFLNTISEGQIERIMEEMWYRDEA